MRPARRLNLGTQRFKFRFQRRDSLQLIVFAWMARSKYGVSRCRPVGIRCQQQTGRNRDRQ
jgi:hypothetical protein